MKQEGRFFRCRRKYKGEAGKLCGAWEVRLGSDVANSKVVWKAELRLVCCVDT